MSRRNTSLARWGITLIPPESFVEFKDIVLSDKCLYPDDNLMDLLRKIKRAIDGNKFMIHYRVDLVC